MDMAQPALGKLTPAQGPTEDCSRTRSDDIDLLTCAADLQPWPANAMVEGPPDEELPWHFSRPDQWLTGDYPLTDPARLARRGAKDAQVSRHGGVHSSADTLTR
jgi:hypothetical protein